MTSGLSGDTRRILIAQGARAGAYGFGAVLLGATLQRHRFSSVQVGVVLSAVLAGCVATSLLLARWADQVGRRRCYAALYVALAAAGVSFALSDRLWLLVTVALTGAMSTDVVESGPFTSLEQTMLATDMAAGDEVRGFGLYNAVAAAAGSLGALATIGPELLRRAWPGAPDDQHYFLVFVPVAVAGVALAGKLSPAVEADRASRGRIARLGSSRSSVVRLSALFCVDAAGGGLVVQAFVAYWLKVRFGTPLGTLGVIFFATGVTQALSFLLAVRLARRIGLLPTMVLTHLPSNIVLAAIAFAPNLAVATTLLLARVLLSQMDVPARQAYVMTLVAPEERMAAGAYTNTARYLVRPAGPSMAGLAQSVAVGLPFVAAGSIKTLYDLVLWRSFRAVKAPDCHDKTENHHRDSNAEDTPPPL